MSAGATWPGFASKMSALRLATIAITVSKQVFFFFSITLEPRIE